MRQKGYPCIGCGNLDDIELGTFIETFPLETFAARHLLENLEAFVLIYFLLIFVQNFLLLHNGGLFPNFQTGMFSKLIKISELTKTNYF